MSVKKSLADRIVPDDVTLRGYASIPVTKWLDWRDRLRANIAELERGATRYYFAGGWPTVIPMSPEKQSHHTHTALLIDVQPIADQAMKIAEELMDAHAPTLKKLTESERYDSKKQAAERLRKLADTEVVNTEPMFDALNEIADSLDPKPPEMPPLNKAIENLSLAVSAYQGDKTSYLFEAAKEAVEVLYPPKPEPVPVNEVIEGLRMSPYDFAKRHELANRIEAARKAGHPTGVCE